MVSGGPGVDLLDCLAVANIKSQIKRNRQNERRRVRNKATRSRLRTEVKRVEAAAAPGDAEGAETRLRETARMLDKAASKGSIHRRTAARRKSKLARAVNAARSS
jgi:small subunit ribosomal protein S20